MDSIKLFVKNEKELDTLIQTIKLYSLYTKVEFSIEKSRKDLNAWRKEKLQVLDYIGSRHHQTNEDERKNNKRVLQINKKCSRNQCL